MADARGQLITLVRPLGPDGLARARRGGWTVARILEHVLHWERLYAQALAALTGAPTPALDASEPQTTAEFIAVLDSTRAAALEAIGHATEDNFYELQALGREEFSVMSALENVAHHDREHADQIARTLNEG